MTSATHPVKYTRQYLSALREQLAEFRTFSCSLMHEQVIGLPDTSLPVNTDIADLAVRRKGFCTPQIRRKLIGCAHSTANDRFARVADAVHATGILGDTVLPSSIISSTALRIYRMDHEKSRLDKRYAVAEYNNDAAEIISIQHELSDVLARHKAAVAEMEAYRNRLLNCIDENIKRP
jgi:hypothetical protein